MSSDDHDDDDDDVSEEFSHHAKRLQWLLGECLETSPHSELVLSQLEGYLLVARRGADGWRAVDEMLFKRFAVRFFDRTSQFAQQAVDRLKAQNERHEQALLELEEIELAAAAADGDGRRGGTGTGTGGGGGGGGVSAATAASSLTAKTASALDAR